MSNRRCGGWQARRQRVGDELRRAVVQARELGVETRREAVEDLLDIGVGRARWRRLTQAGGELVLHHRVVGVLGQPFAVQHAAWSSSPSSTSARITWSRA